MSETILFGKRVKEFKNRTNAPIYDLADLENALAELDEEKIMTLPELILALFYAQKDYPIMGMILLMKEIFLVEKEYATQENIKVQDAEFFSYKYGPYSIDVDKVINTMEEFGFILSRGRKSSDKEIFYLSNSGKERAKEIFDNLTPEQQIKLQNLRKGWDQLGVKGILKLVYTNYSEYTDKSEIKKQVLRKNNVNRIRG